jgi:hypothetical protein
MIEIFIDSPTRMKKRLTKHKYVEDIAYFCIFKLMPRMKNLDITIEFKNKLVSDEGVYGSAYSEDSRTKNPREFRIEVDSALKMRALLQTICHEMVHVKQYARNELDLGMDFDLAEDGCGLVAKKYSIWHGERVGNLDYWDQPWEIEARGRECGLFIRWAEARKLANKEWTQVDDIE